MALELTFSTTRNDLAMWDLSKLRPLPETSVIIPTFNEAHRLEATICQIKSRANQPYEVIIADGFSSDSTVRVARRCGVKVIQVRGGRSSQLNAGANVARSLRLLFLHADTVVPEAFDSDIAHVLAGHKVVAGSFRLGIDSHARGVRIVEAVANWRSQLLQRPYGDQGLFLTRQQFGLVGGYPALPFLDDYEMVKRIARHGRIGISRKKVVTSGRRWEVLGVVRTTLMNQIVLCAYHLGVPPEKLRTWYRSALNRAADIATAKQKKTISQKRE